MRLSINATNFEQEVLKAPIPVLVNFWAPWCGVCHWVNPVLNQFQATADPYFKIVSINADENLKLANAYQLKTLPTLLVVDRGQVVQRLEGLGREHLRSVLEGLIQAYSIAQVA